MVYVKELKLKGFQIIQSEDERLGNLFENHGKGAAVAQKASLLKCLTTHPRH